MADILRDKVEDYKAYILSLLFFKRLSDNYEWENKNAVAEFEKEQDRLPTAKEEAVIYKKKHDFKIPEGCFWKDVREATIDKKNEALHKAVNGIAEANVDKDGKFFLKGVINTVRWNEPAPDDSGRKKLSPEVLSLLVSYLDAVDLSNKNASVDVLGDAYEYLIKPKLRVREIDGKFDIVVPKAIEPVPSFFVQGILITKRPLTFVKYAPIANTR